MTQSIKRNGSTIIALIIFLILCGWWFALRSTSLGDESLNKEYFSAYYGFLALYGGLLGLNVAKKWGGFKSYMGKTIAFLSLGLLAQEFGQIVYSIYSLFLAIEIPYPSLGDLGFFGSIPLYIVGVWNLGKVVGINLSLQKVSGKFQAIILPLGMLLLSYIVFLQDYEASWDSPLATFLDFGYPLGQAIYISGALLVYFLSRNVLGGVMKSRILFVLSALVFQYASDFVFLFQVSRETWETAGINELMYLTSYLVMTLALISIDQTFDKLKNSEV